MKSKAEIIRENLAGLNVLDIGGAGYGEDNSYELELREAWKSCKTRTSVDLSEKADISVNLNDLPLPPLSGDYDMAAAFDVLEHLEHPVDVLRWIPCSRLIAILPNALSWLTRRMEERYRSKHLYSFTTYTGAVMLKEGGWLANRIEYQFGKWSLAARLINLAGSVCPSRIATGLVFYCDRIHPHQ